MAITIPRSVKDWNIYKLEELVDADYFETDSLDFKELLVVKQDPKYKIKLSKTACAFANTRGGFLIFGVADRDSDKKGRDRLSGIPLSDDLARLFGDKIAMCEPTIYYEPLNPPIGIGEAGDKGIFIVHIPQSNNAPHGFKNGEAFYYYKRTNKGNEPMSFNELSSAHTNRLIKQGQMQLLDNELVDCKSMNTQLEVTDRGKKGVKRQVVAWDSFVLDYLCVELYPVLKEYPVLFQHLRNVSGYNSVVNSYIVQFPILLQAGADPKGAIKSYNNKMKNIKPKIHEEIDQAREILKQEFLA